MKKKVLEELGFGTICIKTRDKEKKTFHLPLVKVSKYTYFSMSYIRTFKVKNWNRIKKLLSGFKTSHSYQVGTVTMIK